jgi:hypothetical protein
MSYWGSPGRLIGVVALLSTVPISPPIAQNAQVVAPASRTQFPAPPAEEKSRLMSGLPAVHSRMEAIPGPR